MFARSVGLVNKCVQRGESVGNGNALTPGDQRVLVGIIGCGVLFVLLILRPLLFST